MVAAIMFSRDYLGFAIALLVLDAAVLISLIAGASMPRPAASGRGV